MEANARPQEMLRFLGELLRQAACAAVQTADFVGGSVFCRERNDQYGRDLAHTAADFDSILCRQHAIEQQDIEIFLKHALPSASPICSGQCLEALVFQFHLQKTGDAPRVFHKQYFAFFPIQQSSFPIFFIINNFSVKGKVFCVVSSNSNLILSFLSFSFFILPK